MIQELLNKYLWLVNQFVNAGDSGLTLPEVSRRWEDRWGVPYNRRSFCNHREAISEVFGVDIECDRATNRDFIRGGEDIFDEAGNAAWLINTFTVNNLLSLSRERLRGRISVEPVPSGQKWLTSIMEAMDSGHLLRISYRKYGQDEASQLNVRPYGLKEHERRWYLIAWCEERNAQRVYALDRICSLEVSEDTFKPPRGFDLDELFAGSFGIYNPAGKKIQRVLFKADGRESSYLRDLPMHSSQKELSPGLFELRVVPDDNLLIELCRRGSRIEVLEPQELREKVAGEHRKAADLYEDI